MSDSLTDEHHDWASAFTGIATRVIDAVTPGAQDQSSAPAADAAPAPSGQDTSSSAAPASAPPAAAPASNGGDSAPPPQAAPGAVPVSGLPSDLPAVQITVKVPVGELDWEYVTVEGEITYDVTYKVVGSTSNQTLVLENLKPQIETKLSEQIKGATSVTGGTKVSDRKGSIDIGVETDLGGGAKTSVDFEFMEADGKKGTVTFASLEWKTESQLAKGETEVASTKIEYERKYAVAIKFKPNWKQLGIYAAEKLGLQVGEDAALGTAAGGTGVLGAAAVAAAPVAGIIGGLLGGVALTAGVCAGIGKLEDLGADATAVCQDGVRQLRAYAGSYGSTMRGTPGSDPAGSKDAEAALQEIMSKTPGLTHDQAVQAATDSKQNYEEIVFHHLLPTMRDRVRATYKQKEGTLAYFFSENTLEIVLKEFLGDDVHY